MLSDEDIRNLILENISLKNTKIEHCKGCRNLNLHPCGAFYWCDRLGAVDPNRDGCSKKLKFEN